MPRPRTKKSWIQFGNIKDIAIVRNDVIAIASGIHVMFLDLSTREERIEEFDSAERGKGASCLAGHPIIPIFATAERRPNPKIYIFTYPLIRKVSNCVLVEGGPSAYLSSAFAGNEYLLTLTSYPDFRIIVWLWRTGENMASIDTTITDHRQRISCSPSSPYQVFQLGEFSGELAVYEINACSRILMISRASYDVSSTNKRAWASWTPDGNLFHCDVTGNVTLNYNDGKRRYSIVRGEDIDTSNSKGNLLLEAFRSGLVLVDGRSRIMFYRKSTGPDNRVKSASLWKSAWSVQAISHPGGVLRSSHRDSLLFYGKEGEIFELSVSEDDDTPKIRVIARQGSKYEFISAVNPRRDELVAIDESNRLSVFQCLTGQSVASCCLKIYGRVRCITSHPHLPTLAIGTMIGKFLLINLNRITQPSVARVMHLQRDSLDIIRYSWYGGLLGVADTLRSKLFVFGNDVHEHDSKNFVPSLLDLKMEMIDFLVYDRDEESTKILVLVKTGKSFKCGNRMIVYSFTNEQYQEECVIETTNMLDSLFYGRHKDEFIVVPYSTKQLHFMTIQDDFRGITLAEALSSGHQLRKINLSVNDHFLVTCGYDGLIIARNRTKIQQVVAIFMSHYRLDDGAKCAVLSSSTGTIVSLGRNGDLTATQICVLAYVSNIKEPTPCPEKSNDIVVADDLTWLERTAMTNLKKERDECDEERVSILQDLSDLRERVRIFLDANENETAEARLPISCFDLDEKSRGQKLHDNIENVTAMTKKLENEIYERDQVSKFIRKLCWDSMEIQACRLLSMNGETRVDNFGLPRVTTDRNERRRWESFVVEFQSSDGKVSPEMEMIPENLSIAGSTTANRFVPELADRSKMQIGKCRTYNEGVTASIAIKQRERKLKMYFNEMFEEMRSVKERELNSAARRLEEIEYCALELKNMFDSGVAECNTLLQPLWHYTEKPDSIVTVTEDEISKGRAATYLTRDVRLELLKKIEEENLKLNDNFREEALERMMDGLLEVRWEDEIKKDPTRPPSFLSAKDPSTYTAEEAAEWELYRFKCEELRRERQRYKQSLQDKILEVKESLKRDAKAFDRRLDALRLVRMKIESAVLQEASMRLRESRRHSSLRRRGMEIMDSAQNALSSAVKELRDLNDIATVLESAVADARNRWEILSKRDKTFEAKFRGEFPDLKQPMVEHLSRHYRKRPRNVRLTCTSITYLTEIGRCVVSGEKSEILPEDCLNFLRGIDSLDVMPNNLPALIDATHWNLLCKLRRAKIELEIKIKSCAVDLAEAEQTFVLHQKSCTCAEIKVSRMKEATKEREIENFKLLEDMEVQMVLKMGQIESKLHGCTRELYNAVLVPLYVVERANNAITAAGGEKLAAMRKTILFRRTILWHEWRHKCLRIRLDDMREELRVLRGVKVTREIQNYLLTDSRPGETEKKAKTCKLIVAATIKRSSGRLDQKKRQLDDTGRSIKRWRKRTRRLVDSIEAIKVASFDTSMLVHDEKRRREAKYRRTIFKAIMKRTIATKKVRENYAELLELRTQLELLRLKTYPTLRLKELTRRNDPSTTNKREANLH